MLQSIRAFVSIFPAFVLVSCVNIISPYDEKTDSATTELQKDTVTFLMKMSSLPNKADRSFAKNQEFYQNAAVDVDALETRTSSIAKNELTVAQVKLIKQNLAYLALLHKGCVSKPLEEPQIDAIDKNGIDVGLDCRVEYGATFDAKARGGLALAPEFAVPIKQQFDVAFGALLKLELAKKSNGGSK